MKIFVSSVITGFKEERAAVRDAILSLGHEPVMAEDFGAQPNSPQVACLQGLRSADLVILVLGERYGARQSSGLSATHEEYLEARDSKPLLAFVGEGISPEVEQSALIAEVEEWAQGSMRQDYGSADDLRAKATRSMHQFEIATAVAPTDIGELKSIAAASLPSTSTGYSYARRAALNLAIFAGPRQQVIRPATLEEAEFKEWLHQTVLFGSARILDPASGTEVNIKDDALVIEQEDAGSITLRETADQNVVVPIGKDPSRGSYGMSESSVLIEEDVVAALQSGLQAASTILDHVDTTQRLTHVAIAVSVTGAENRAWRTRTEHAANPNSIEIPWRQSDLSNHVVLDRKRGALNFDRTRLIEDLIVPLRRRWRK